MRILIVDDNHMDRIILRKILESTGYANLIEISSAIEVSKYLRNNFDEDVPLVDLILTDLMMREIDGIEFCRQIRLEKRFDNVPIIAISSSSNMKNLKKAFEVGVSDYITKPINPIEVITRIKSVLKFKLEKDGRKKREEILLSDLKMAKQIQMNMLPKSLNKEKIVINGFYNPETFLGGDLYYWKKVDHFKYGMILFDVMGHGTATSMICMYIRSLLPGVMSVKDPKIVIEELNKHMIRFNHTVNNDIDYYLTAIYVVIDTKEKTIEYVNAGHPRGIMLYEDGRHEFLEEGCIPIGITAELNITIGRLSYKKPFELYIYSDGISDFLGVSKDKVLNSIEQLYEKNHDNFSSFLEYIMCNIELVKRKDDISIVHIKVRP
ncbi:PP2C family protein-serine/threonine phosphatase [Crassaminicella profunda]|uniref:PP2C family protein-serine/threonine phosphatase n=1 Tax=Crassaminicella profunda TaxID=1286698 RepID=UPI001FE60245|nr:fused response regulator/phosphatase [Crassaminicella profunda]